MNAHHRRNGAYRTTIQNAAVAVALCSGMLTTGCVPGFVATYHVDLVDVDRAAEAESRFGVAEFVDVEGEDGTTHAVEDGLLRMVFTLLESRIPFVLINKTDQPLTLVWDDALFIDLLGAPHKVMHRNVRYEDRRKPLRPTIVAPRDTIRDFILPVHLVSLSPDAKWEEQPYLSPYRRETVEELQPALENRGRTFGLYLPFDTNGKVYEYMITFRVMNVELP